ncbi:MAG: protein-disulfide reductase DsbD domain-containing protein [Myxococcota bacterium]
MKVALRGGKGTIRQGIVRHAIARFELADGFHLYGEPVPEGMIPTQVQVSGPPGLVVHDPVLPPTAPLRLASMGVELQVWSGSFDIEIPFHAVGELVSECRPLDRDAVPIEVHVRYQACNDETCLLPKTETFRFDVPLDVVDIPKLGMHRGHGQREGNFDATPHLKRLLKRKFKESPLGFLRHAVLAARLNVAAKLRSRRDRASS